MINHDEYIKRRDLALNRYFAHRAAGIKTAHEEAQQAIDALVLAVIGEDGYLLSQNDLRTKQRSIVEGGE